MSIPDFDGHGLLPHGEHHCSIDEARARLTWNPHRVALFESFSKWMTLELRPNFREPLYFDGSYCTDKAVPADIDVVLDLRSTPPTTQLNGLLFQAKHQTRFHDDYKVHFWINIDGSPYDFAGFFQYVGVKTAILKGLDPRHPKGILRLV